MHSVCIATPKCMLLDRNIHKLSGKCKEFRAFGTTVNISHWWEAGRSQRHYSCRQKSNNRRNRITLSYGLFFSVCGYWVPQSFRKLGVQTSLLGSAKFPQVGCPHICQQIINATPCKSAPVFWNGTTARVITSWITSLLVMKTGFINTCMNQKPDGRACNGSTRLHLLPKNSLCNPYQ